MITFVEWIVLVLLIDVAANIGDNLAVRFLGRSLRIAFVSIVLASFALVMFAMPARGYLTVKLFASFLGAMWFLNWITSYLRSINSWRTRPKFEALAEPEQQSALQSSLRAWVAGQTQTKV